ncbi:MAG: DUF2608 domain-containing protein [Parachlamydiales bacterium]|nr:DUF2608 domain-containing protein [Parachlamydiales bacterium]
MTKAFLFLLLLAVSLHGKILDIKNISQIEPYSKNVSLIIFDLDNTIYEPIQTLGSDQWFDYTLDKYQKKGLSFDEALDETRKDWYLIQTFTKVKLVEEKTKSLIENFQNSDSLVIGLTTRDIDFAFSALNHLDSIGIDFTKKTFLMKNLLISENILYRKGILFCSGSDKGKALEKLLNKVDFHPKSIIFVDDKLKNVQQVEKFCTKNKIEYFGFRYGYLDQKVKDFDKKIADTQWHTFRNSFLDENIFEKKIK